MATRHVIPVARLNSRVRKRLIDILSGREIPNKSLIHSSSPGFECQQHLGQLHVGEGSRPSNLDGSKRCKIESVGQLKAKHFQETLQLSLQGKGLMEPDKTEEQDDGNEPSSKSKSDLAIASKEIPKSKKGRRFRKFMRTVAGTQDGPSREDSRGDYDLAQREKLSRRKARSTSSKKNGKLAKTKHEKSVSNEDRHDKDDFTPNSKVTRQNFLTENAGKGLIDGDGDKGDGSGNDTLCVNPGDVLEKVDVLVQSGNECFVTASSGSCETKGKEVSVEINSRRSEKNLEVQESQDDLTRNTEANTEISKNSNNDSNANEKVSQNDDISSESMTNECRSKHANNGTAAQAEQQDDSYCLDVLFDPASYAKSGVFYKVGQKVAQKKRETRKRRGKKDNEQKLEEGLAEENIEEGATMDDGCKKNQKRLPNYFLALKVDDTTIADNVKQFQESVIEKEPAFKNIMIAIPTLHLTLMVMRLDNDIDIDNAKQALKSLKEKSGDLFAKWSKEVSFTGIDTFRNKVIYLGIDHEKHNESITIIQEIVRFAHECFSTSGVVVTEDKSKGGFIPHVTVMKMSKNIHKMKKKGIKKVDEEYYNDFAGFEFGQQRFSDILLCSMFDKKDQDGFYQVIDSIDLNGKHE